MSKRKQISIEDMLLKKFKQCVQQDEEQEPLKDKNVTRYLLKKNNILNEHEKCEVSTMTKVYFRENSNFDEILNLYLQKENKSSDCKEKYVTSLIRNLVIGRNFIQFYPFNKFKFKSAHHECIAKMLLTYPRIRSEEDLKDVHEYLTKECIQLCQVDLTLNNRMWPIEKRYLDNQKKKHGYENLINNLCKATDLALRDYYEEKELTENIDFDYIKVEELCEISNFSDVVKHHMKKNNLPMTEFDTVAQQILQTMKDNRELVVTGFTGFRIKPRFNLISNNITPEQTKIIARKRENFFKYTNAKLLVSLNKHKMPLNEELEFDEKRRIRRDNFFLKYIRTPHDKKKNFPFHNLCVLKRHENFDAEIQQLATTKQAQESQSKTSNLWRNKNVTRKNEEIAFIRSDDDQQCRIKDIQQTASDGNNYAANKLKKERDLEDYLNVYRIPPNFNHLIALLADQVDVVKTLKRDIKIQNEAFFKTYWKRNKNVITCNYIYFSLIDRNEKFLKILENSDMIVNSCLEAINIPLNCDHFEDQDFATSAQTDLDELLFENDENVNIDNQRNAPQTRPFPNPNSSFEDVVVINQFKKSHVPPIPQCVPQIPVEIKQEPLSESINVFKDSDVLYVAPVHEILTISDDEEKIAAIQPSFLDQSKRVDRFWQELRNDSQEQQNQSENHDDLSAEYNLIMFERRNVTTRKLLPKKITTRSNLRNQVDYIDEGINNAPGPS